jgi:hypothetical protein
LNRGRDFGKSANEAPPNAANYEFIGSVCLDGCS